MARGDVSKTYRRQPPGTCPACGQCVSPGDVVIDSHHGIIRRGGLEVRMEPRLTKLLDMMMRGYPLAVHMDLIIMDIWPDSDDEPDKPERTIYTLMCIMRKAVAPLGIDICSQRAFGYYVRLLPIEAPRLKAVS